MYGEIKNIYLVAGTRPNFMKVAPLWQELGKHREIYRTYLIHTGQHYDPGMSSVFFSDLHLPTPHYNLGVGSGSYAQQIGKIMVAFEGVCDEVRPELVVVVGDVNSTIACALIAKNLCIPVAHVEAGLRSGDLAMPEEINRILTDRISDFHFIHSRDAEKNLLAEGISPQKIHFVGNVMIDSLRKLLPRATESSIHARLNLGEKEYAVVTVHRPSNVDDPKVLRGILEVIVEMAETIPIVWPIHPRARQAIQQLKLEKLLKNRQNLHAIHPLGYIDMLALTKKARVILTDSGGLQEEAVVLGVPCLTLRNATERPVTVEVGGNCVVGTQPSDIKEALKSLLNRKGRAFPIPELWDGKAAIRIVDVLINNFS